MSEIRYEAASSLRQAVELLSQASGRALALAGGTDVFGTLKDGIHADRDGVVLVDLKTIPGLDKVSVEDGELVIGAMARLADVAADDLVRERAPLLAQAAGLVASPQLREMGTVGGNLCQEPRCWYYRYPGDVFHCHRKGGELCAAAVGDDRFHSVYGAARVVDPPCTTACPNDTAIPAYLEKLRRLDADAAARELLAQNPMPAITGRICPHLCEDGCNRAELDEPVSIRSLERRVGDHILAEPRLFLEGCAPSTGKRVSVVGSGPAGLAAAFYLRRQGHRVTVIERESFGGGMLSLGIPPFRLDRDVVSEVLGLYEKLGVEFRFGVEAGRDIALDELRAEADAVVVACGAWLNPRIGIDGEEQAVAGLEYLREAALDADLRETGTVVVVGGGNVAVDCAMTAVARGAASVVMACLESREEMPAFEWEIEEARERGVELRPGWGPKAIRIESGAVAGVDLVRCASVFDENGVFCPALDDSVTDHVAADKVVLAVGQRVDRGWYADAVSAAVSAADGETDGEADGEASPAEAGHGAAEASRGWAGVVVCGDAQSGPATVVEAIASGRRAAAQVGQRLAGADSVLPGDALPHSDGATDSACLQQYNGAPDSAGVVQYDGAPDPASVVQYDGASGLACAFLAHDVAGSRPSPRALAGEPAGLSSRGAAAAALAGDEAAVCEAKRCLNCSCLAVSPSDLAPALMALDARVVTTMRVLKAAELFAASLGGSTVLECGELLLAVRVPLRAGSQGAAFKKFRPRKSIDFPVVNAAVALTITGGTIADARVCAGAVAPVPLRLRAAEQALAGQRPVAEVFARAAAVAVAGARPLHKNAYKRQILEVLVRRALEEAAGLAGAPLRDPEATTSGEQGGRA